MSGPHHHVFTYVDVEGSTRMSGPQKVEMRADLGAMLQRACWRSEISEVDKGDRGDGALLVSESVVPIRKVVEGFAAELDESLRARTVGDLRLRLRLIVHQGDLVRDGDGWSGPELDRAARMIEAVEVKDALAGAPDGRLAFVVAPEVYRNVILGYAVPDYTAFRMCRVTAKEGPLETWLTIMGAAKQPGRPADEEPIRSDKTAMPSQYINRDHWNVGSANNSVLGSRFSGGAHFGTGGER